MGHGDAAAEDASIDQLEGQGQRSQARVKKNLSQGTQRADEALIKNQF